MQIPTPECSKAPYDGRRYGNLIPVPRPGFWRVARWLAHRRRAPWPRHVTPERAPDPELSVTNRLKVTWVNHATTLVQLDGFNILTDPIWSERASPVRWAGPRRVMDPGISFEKLPPIHATLISHNHYDHMDLSTLRRIQAAHPCRFFCGLGNAKLLQAKGIGPVEELDWWQQKAGPGGMRILSVPAVHWSGRWFRDRFQALWTGFVIVHPQGNIYFAGDSGYGPHFSEIGRCAGPIRLSILPIGAYLPHWFMSPFHISPIEAVKAHVELGASQSLAVHYDTFRLSDEGYGEPPLELRRAIKETGLKDEAFWTLTPGVGRDVPLLKHRVPSAV